mgnify:CR=1 FL=1
MTATGLSAPIFLSILTAPEGAVQFKAGRKLEVVGANLSILTAPEGAVQSAGHRPFYTMSNTFQSSPPPKERCNCAVRKASGWLVGFQSSPPPKERRNLLDFGGVLADVCPFNPHRPRRSGAISGVGMITEVVEGLSILTAPEGAVQCTEERRIRSDALFQSSPPPKERCNRASTIPRRARSHELSILTAPEGAVQSWTWAPARRAARFFQSSPPPKERCNRVRPVRLPGSHFVFQSSPPPKERCNHMHGSARRQRRGLSILTAPEGAVQYAERVEPPHASVRLSILTAPEGAVQCE